MLKSAQQDHSNSSRRLDVWHGLSTRSAGTDTLQPIGAFILFQITKVHNESDRPRSVEAIICAARAGAESSGPISKNNWHCMRIIGAPKPTV
jgi:hypothetical protein